MKRHAWSDPVPVEALGRIVTETYTDEAAKPRQSIARRCQSAWSSCTAQSSRRPLSVMLSVAVTAAVVLAVGGLSDPGSGWRAAVVGPVSAAWDSASALR